MGFYTYATSLKTDRLDRMLSGALKRQAAVIVRKTALDVLADAQGFCPVDTGYLRSSLSVGAEGNTFEVEDDGLTIIVGTSVEYAPFVEFGSRKSQAQPFLSPAVEAERPAFEAACASLLGRVIS